MKLIVYILTSVYLVSFCYSMHYITFKYTMSMFKAWPLLTVATDLIGQLIIIYVQYIHHVLFQTITFILSLHPTY